MKEIIVNYDEVLNSLPIWASSEIECQFCNNTWLGVHTIFNNKLECPNCKNMNDIGYIPLQEKFN